MRLRSYALLLVTTLSTATLVIPIAASAMSGSPLPRHAGRTAASPPISTAAWRGVSYHGISIEVPKAWPVINLTTHPDDCPRLDVHAVYLGTPGPNPACPTNVTGRADAVQITPLSPGDPALTTATRRVAGYQAVYATPDPTAERTFTDVILTANVKLSVYYKDSAAIARAIVATLRIAESAQPGKFAALTKPATQRVQAGPAQGVYAGPGFDACAVPALSTMTKWLASKYRAIGVYIGGVNRGCPQQYLTANWLTSIQSQGWHYFPLYVGLQSACIFAYGNATISGAQAAQEGRSAADDAATQAASLGIAAGTPLFYDMEAYGPSCDNQVTTFLSAWDAELHARGYDAGIYESFSNIGALITAATRITEPDVIYYADWDGIATTNSSYMPGNIWTGHQRIHQYSGGHNETYGGVTINIDGDQLDASLGGSSQPPPPWLTHAGFRISVAINSNGTAEWFARTAAGQVAHAWQAPVGALTWSNARTVGNSPKGIVANPTAVAQQDGSLAVFARDSAGGLQHAWQQAGYPNGWHWGTPLPAAPGGALPGTDPAAVKLPTGQIAVFQTTNAGTVVMDTQASPGNNANWSGWKNLGGTCAGTPVPLADARHDVDLFCVSQGDTVGLATWNGKNWSAWSFAENIPHNLAGTPTAVVNSAGQTEFFAATANGTLDYAWQNPANGNWNWKIGIGGASAGLTGSPTVAAWPGGQVAVYAQLSGGKPGVLIQTGANGAAGFGGWTKLSGPNGGSIVGSPTGWLNTGGAPGLIALGSDLKIAVANAPNNTWSPWSQLLGGF